MVTDLIDTSRVDDWPSNLSGKRVSIINPLREYWSIKFCAEAALLAAAEGAQVTWFDVPVLWPLRLSQHLDINASNRWKWWWYQDPLKQTRRILGPQGVRFDTIPRLRVHLGRVPRSLRELDSWTWNGLGIGYAVHASMSGQLFKREFDLLDPQHTAEVALQLRMAAEISAGLSEKFADSRPDYVFTTNDRTLPGATTLLTARHFGLHTRILYFGAREDTMAVYGSSLYSQRDKRRHSDDLWNVVIRERPDIADRERHRTQTWIDEGSEVPGSLDFTTQMVSKAVPRACRPKRLVFFTSSPWEFSGAQDHRSGDFPDQMDALRSFLKILPAEEWEVVVRHHPVHPMLGDVSEAESWSEFKSDPRVIQICPDDSLDSMALAQSATLNAVWVSSIGLRIAAQGLPLLVCGPAFWSDSRLCTSARSSDELAQVDLNAVKGSDPPVELLSATTYYLQNHGRGMTHTSGLGNECRIRGERVFQYRWPFLHRVPERIRVLGGLRPTR